MSSVFWLGAFIFLISTLYFQSREKGFNFAFFVSLVTFISYVIMAQGNYVFDSPSGEPIYYTRWIFYALSCGLLMYEIAHKTGMSKEDTVENIFLTIIVMLTGAYAAINPDMYKWIFFVISSFAYALLVRNVLNSTSKKTRWIENYIIYGWTLFPVAFLIAPAGIDIMTAMTANFAYLILDIYTKIIFSQKALDK